MRGFKEKMCSNWCGEAEEFFDSISDDIAESIIVDISESIWTGDDVGCVTLLECGSINISNKEGTGTFEYNDHEYLFIARSGDDNGDEIIAFEESALNYERDSGTMMIIPILCSKYTAKDVLEEWDSIKNSQRIQNILSEICSYRYTNCNYRHLTRRLENTGLGYMLGDAKEAEMVREKLTKLYALRLLEG